MSKVLGIYVNFTKTTHQIWPCHVTLASNFKNFYFLPNSVLKCRKVTKFGGNWPKNKKLQIKNNKYGGRKHPPPPVLILISDKCVYQIDHCTLACSC